MFTVPTNFRLSMVSRVTRVGRVSEVLGSFALPMAFAVPRECTVSPECTVPRVSRLPRVFVRTTVSRLSGVPKFPTLLALSAVRRVSRVSVDHFDSCRVPADTFADQPLARAPHPIWPGGLVNIARCGIRRPCNLSAAEALATTPGFQLSATCRPPLVVAGSRHSAKLLWQRCARYWTAALGNFLGLNIRDCGGRTGDLSD